eukprot:1192668-Prorocentrum_minimum.AAC.4
MAARSPNAHLRPLHQIRQLGVVRRARRKPARWQPTARWPAQKQRGGGEGLARWKGGHLVGGRGDD